MFICQTCIDANYFNFAIPSSYGSCEECGTKKMCADIPSNLLMPKPTDADIKEMSDKMFKQKMNEAIEHWLETSLPELQGDCVLVMIHEDKKHISVSYNNATPEKNQRIADSITELKQFIKTTNEISENQKQGRTGHTLGLLNGRNNEDRELIQDREIRNGTEVLPGIPGQE